MDLNGGFFITEDGGKTWTEKLPGTNFNAIAIHPNNSNEIWVGSGYNPDKSLEAVYKSTDGGNNWDKISFNFTPGKQDVVTDIVFNPNTPNQIFVLEENEIFISQDGGNNWTHDIYPIDNQNIEKYYYGKKISFNPNSPQELVLNGNYFGMKSNDAGRSFTRIKNPFVGTNGDVKIKKNGEDKYLYYNLQQGLAYKNLTTSEEDVHHLIPNNVSDIVTDNVHSADDNVPNRTYSMLGQMNGVDFKISNDNGATSHNVYQTFASYFIAKSYPSDPNKIVVAFALGDQSELVEIDITDIENPMILPIMPPDWEGVVYDFMLDSENTRHMIMAQGGKIYKTTDNGFTWEITNVGLEEIENTAGTIVNIAKNPRNTNQITITSTEGIFTSYDKGNNWVKLTNHFAHKIYHSDKENVMIGVAHTSNFAPFSVILSVDGGQKWEVITDENLYNIITTHTLTSSAVDFHEGSADIYLSAIGLGLIKINIDFTTLSVSEPALISKSQVSIHPNPTSNLLNINTQEKVHKVEVYSASGQKMIESSSAQVDISSLSPSVYYVKVYFEKGNFETKKVIKK